MKWLVAMGFLCCLTRVALADTPLRIARSDQPMRVDGSLREWRGARFAQLGTGEGSLQYALAHRDGGLYLGARVKDPAIVRGRGLGGGQDALVLTFAMPSRAGRWVGTEVWLHPGVPGRTAAAAGVARGGGRPRPAPRVEVVEGPGDDDSGYVLEAFIPWQAVREAELWQMGRGSLRYRNAARPGKAETTAHTAPKRRLAELPPLVSGAGEVDALARFLKAQSMAAAEPRFDLKGNVYGGSGPERVSIVKGHVVLTGPEVGDGKSFAFTRLPLGRGAVTEARLRDLTGDGLAELQVAMRQTNAQGQRTVWGVVQLSRGEPQLVFGVETAKQVSGGEIEASLRVSPGDPPSIVVEPRGARGVSPDGYRERPAQDVEPILLPWGPVRRRVYRFTGGRFALVDEQRDPAKAPQPVQAPAQPARQGQPAVAPAPGEAEVAAAAKRALGLPASRKPDRRLRANLAGDARPETLLAYGTQLVALGPGIGDGQGYLVYSVPLPSADALLDVRCADVTGDGRAEVLVRVRQSLGQPGVEREVLLVQQLSGRGMQRVLAVEVARSMGEARIDNAVQLGGGRLRIGAGRARGWDADSYPFPDAPVGGVGRLLLPWKDRSPRRYRLVHGKLQP